MYEHNALGYWSCLALCLTKVRSSRARCPATALITVVELQSRPTFSVSYLFSLINPSIHFGCMLKYDK